MTEKNKAIKQLVIESINKYGKTFEMLKEYDNKTARQSTKKMVDG